MDVWEQVGPQAWSSAPLFIIGVETPDCQHLQPFIDLQVAERRPQTVRNSEIPQGVRHRRRGNI